MAHVTIFGNGNMGQAIAGLVLKGGNTVQVLTRADAATPVSPATCQNLTTVLVAGDDAETKPN